jgi:hypothetical protein
MHLKQNECAGWLTEALFFLLLQERSVGREAMEEEMEEEESTRR